MARAFASHAVFHAVADPTRRSILDLLATSAEAGEIAVSELAAPFRMSLPAISQHLRILREAGLVRVRKAGRRRLYRLDATGLKDIHDWTAHYERFWNEKLGALGDYLDRQEGDAS